jgi:hypothetical protein
VPTITCPSCHREYKLPEQFAELPAHLQCSHCGASVISSAAPDPSHLLRARSRTALRARAVLLYLAIVAAIAAGTLAIVGWIEVHGSLHGG